MDGSDGYRWEDGQLITLLTERLDDPDGDYPGAPPSGAQQDRPAEFSLEDVVAAGRAAFCWLEVVVTVRELARPLQPTAGTSAGDESGSPLGRSPTRSTTT
ncbi:hypothetical protein [Geodermatophilus sp. URMC 63]